MQKTSDINNSLDIKKFFNWHEIIGVINSFIIFYCFFIPPCFAGEGEAEPDYVTVKTRIDKISVDIRILEWSAQYFDDLIKNPVKRNDFSQSLAKYLEPISNCYTSQLILSTKKFNQDLNIHVATATQASDQGSVMDVINNNFCINPSEWKLYRALIDTKVNDADQGSHTVRLYHNSRNHPKYSFYTLFRINSLKLGSKFTLEPMAIGPNTRLQDVVESFYENTLVLHQNKVKVSLVSDKNDATIQNFKKIIELDAKLNTFKSELDCKIFRSSENIGMELERQNNQKCVQNLADFRINSIPTMYKDNALVELVSKQNKKLTPHVYLWVRFK